MTIVWAFQCAKGIYQTMLVAELSFDKILIKRSYPGLFDEKLF